MNSSKTGSLERTWLDAIVLEIKPDEPHATRGSSLGRLRFQSCPRRGEFISLNDKDGVGQIYEVVSVVHAPAVEDEVPTTIGDIFVVWRSKFTEWSTPYDSR